MTTVALSPVFGGGVQILNNSGVPLANGKIYVYVAGTTTLTNTYTSYLGTTLNPNPVILDSSGRIPTMIWCPVGQAYKYVVTDSTGASVGYTLDSIVGINDAAYVVGTPSEWNQAGTPTYISATSFSLGGDQTAIFKQYRRIKSTNTGGIGYATVVSSTYALGITTIVVTNDSLVLDAGLALVYYGLNNSSPQSLPANVAFAGYGLGGVSNLTLGTLAGPSISGNYNLAIGVGSANLQTSGLNNISIGYYAQGSGIVTGQANVSVGNLSGTSLTIGNFNTALGDGALQQNSTGSSNVAIGRGALSFVTATGYNTVVGAGAMNFAIGMVGNTAIGANSGATGIGPSLGDYNTYLGYNASNGFTSETYANVIGANAVSKGSYTTVIGYTNQTDVYITAGRFRPAQYATAGAPAYVKGAIYFDTTLNKLRVGGASAWETVTSV